MFTRQHLRNAPSSREHGQVSRLRWRDRGPATRRAAKRRRGAAIIEAALVMGVFLTLVIGMLDLAGAVYRSNMLSNAARRGAREAIVHGSRAAPLRSVWGPARYSGTADASSEIAATIRPLLVGMRPEEVTITLEWPDGTNTAPQRVRCRVAGVYRIRSPLGFGPEIPLSATSTMPIAN